MFVQSEGSVVRSAPMPPGADVRNGSKADIELGLTRCQLSANSGHQPSPIQSTVVQCSR